MYVEWVGRCKKKNKDEKVRSLEISKFWPPPFERTYFLNAPNCMLLRSSRSPFQIFLIELLLPFRRFSDSFHYPRTMKTVGFYPYFYFWEKIIINWNICFKKLCICFIGILAFIKLFPVCFSKSLFKCFDGLFTAFTFASSIWFQAN